MAIFSRKLDESDMELTIHLDEVFGQDVPDDRSLKESIGQEVIDIIVDRTVNDNRTWKGQEFGAYTEEYEDSEEFAIWKGTDKTVNLTLRDQMLNDIEVKSIDGQDVVLSFGNSENSAKAHGHVTNWNSTRRKGKAPRDFWGLNKSEANQIKDDFLSEVRRETERTEERRPGAAESFALALLDRLLNGR